MQILLDQQPEHLRNEIVVLKPLHGGSFDELYSIASDPLIWEIHPSPDRYKEENFRPFYEAAVASKSAFLIYESKTAELMGTTRFYEYNPEERSVAIGYTFLGRKFWGGVYNRAIKKLMLDYAFQYVDSVFFHVGVCNYRSQKAVQKLGGIIVREFILETSPSKSPYFEFVIRKSDWIS